jgi:hypothetical protein
MLHRDEALSEDAYHTVESVMCKRVHLANPTTGEVAGEDE